MSEVIADLAQGEVAKTEHGVTPELRAEIERQIAAMPQGMKLGLTWFFQKRAEAEAIEMELWEFLARSEYKPQDDVASMMELFGQEVRPKPVMPADPKERLLTANLVFEETLEFVNALGFIVTADPQTGTLSLTPAAQVTDVPAGQGLFLEPNLVEAADAIGDILVVTYGAANRLGVDAQSIFNEVNRSNMSKVWEDGTIHKRESDGKVIKPPTYSPANIAGVLKALSQ
jgi:predicted HAD superfamily Cof-like phosphohydrolase